MSGQNAFGISIDAFDLDDEQYTRINYSDCINIYAPDMDIKSTDTTSTASYSTRRSTSAAVLDITGSPRAAADRETI